MVLYYPHFTHEEIETNVKSDLPKVIQLESGKSKSQSQIWLTLESVIVIIVTAENPDLENIQAFVY